MSSEARDLSPPGSGRKLLPQGGGGDEDDRYDYFVMEPANSGLGSSFSPEKTHKGEARTTTKAAGRNNDDAAAYFESETAYVPRFITGERFLSNLEKLGRLVLAIVVLAPLSQLCVVAFLYFLWVRPIGNPTWNALVRNEWVTRSVTVASFVIRVGVDLLTGAAASMLAALSLESGE